MESIQKRYNEIVSDGLQEEKGELEELKTLQSQLNGLVGEQETAIDLVNGKYGETIKLLKNLTEEQRKNAMADLVEARAKAVAAFDVPLTFKASISEYIFSFCSICLSS